MFRNRFGFARPSTAAYSVTSKGKYYTYSYKNTHEYIAILFQVPLQKKIILPEYIIMIKVY